MSQQPPLPPQPRSGSVAQTDIQPYTEAQVSTAVHSAWKELVQANKGKHYGKKSGKLVCPPKHKRAKYVYFSLWSLVQEAMSVSLQSLPTIAVECLRMPHQDAPEPNCVYLVPSALLN